MTRTRALTVATIVVVGVAALSWAALAPRRTEAPLATTSPCRILSLAVGGTSGLAAQPAVDLVLTNASDLGACSMMNNPEVELAGPDNVHPASAVVWQLQSGDEKPAKLTLDAEASARLTLVYLPAAPNDDGAWTPAYVIVRPQGQVPLALPWRFGPIVFQQMATHPGTWVGRVELDR